jgi:signal peptidase I
MTSDAALIDRLQALAATAAASSVAPDALAADVLRLHRATHRRRTRRSLLGSLAGVVAAGGVVGATQLGHRSYVLQYEPGRAMAPTVAERESVLIGKSLHPVRGDLVAYRFPVGGGTAIGRVVAVAGDRVGCPPISGGGCAHLLVNGLPVAEPYVPAEKPFAEQSVPAGDVFILGDNREQAYDSRLLGPLDAGRITGVGVRVVALDGTRRTIPGAPDRAAPGDTEIGDPAPLPTAAAAPAG